MALITGFMVRHAMDDEEAAEAALAAAQSQPKLAFAYIECKKATADKLPDPHLQYSLVCIFRENPPEGFNANHTATCARSIMTEDHMCFK